ncbi:MAG: hypothetical protein A3G34_04030 [Candidatus Lindowbacteria bacterium RIFCSPLOWO2_12_FULL_62_27]|nr:MAG: hypothetical protein A3G34_04030 [Candidatus Lindowbacteria bacterium RIFCSPLOWO2_12_FULL_62_27]OGH63620.1 MAG: hypothetical protein A3I06_14170 [Candidatus Lindowbacteria bacterium RIFCSPLOWO2_02_FULL_62_12]
MNIPYLRAILCAAFLAGPALSHAARAEEPLISAGNIKACFIDLQEVLRNYPEYAKAKETLEEWAKPKQKLITEKERQIQQLDNDLKKNLLRSEDSKKEKEGEFKKELGGYQDLVKQLQSELAEKEDELLSPVKETLSKSIEEVSKSKGFNVVFDAAAPSGRPILYVDDSLDITEAVISRVKEAVKSKSEKPEEKKK